jgi:hypothetical protein
MNELEEWRDLVGYEGLYLISNNGKLKSLDKVIPYIDGRMKHMKGKMLKQCRAKTPGRSEDDTGYLQSRLTKNGKSKAWNVHILVARTFIPNPENKPIVNHKDGNKLNNYISNLEWATYSENNQHAYDNNLKSDNTPVLKINLDNGDVIDRYNSIHEAGRKNNINKSNIHSVCNNKRNHAGGFNWRYENEILNNRVESNINIKSCF